MPAASLRRRRRWPGPLRCSARNPDSCSSGIRSRQEMLISFAVSLVNAPSARPSPIRFSGDDAMSQSVKILHLQAQDHIRVGDVAAAIERMPRGEVHAIALVVHRRLQGFGQFHQQLDAVRACAPGGPRRSPDFRRSPAAWPLRRSAAESPCGGMRQASASESRRLRSSFDRLFLQLSAGDDGHRPHGRRHGDLVGPHHRFGEIVGATSERRPTW